MRSEEKDRRRGEKEMGIRQAALRRSRDIFSVTVRHESEITNNYRAYMRVHMFFNYLQGAGPALSFSPL